jgi:hypothetical protein
MKKWLVIKKRRIAKKIRTPHCGSQWYLKIIRVLSQAAENKKNRST